jgi:cytoskeletal protein RodZ
MDKPEWFEATDALDKESDSLESGFGASRLAKHLAFVGVAVVVAGTGIAFAFSNSAPTKANFLPKPTSTPHQSTKPTKHEPTKHESTTPQTAASQTSTPTSTPSSRSARTTPLATSTVHTARTTQPAIGTTSRLAVAGGASGGDDGDNEVNDN